MSDHDQRRARICVIWFCMGIFELPWIGINHIAFIWCSYESDYRQLVNPLAITAYFTSVLFTIFGYLAGSELLKNVAVPAACSLAWGAINSLYGLWISYSFLFDGTPITSVLVVSFISMCFSLSYLYAGWVGFFHVTPKQPISANDSAPAIVGNDPAHS